MLLSLTGIIAACKCKPPTEHEKHLKRVRELIKQDRDFPNLPETGEYFPRDGSAYGSFTLRAGVWVNDRLLYEALGIPMGNAPRGDDVKDREPGIPEAVLGACGRCKRSWKWVEGHSTPFNDHEGCFPLCEGCWHELTPQQRLPYYRAMFDHNMQETRRYQGGKYVSEETAKWPQIQAAVLAGK